MKNKDNNRILITILVGLLIVLCVIICFLYGQMKANPRHDAVKTEVYNKMKQEMVMPNGIFNLKKNYKGKNDLDDFYKSINSLYRVIIELSDKDDKKIEKYFEENRLDIKQNIGIENIESFKKLGEYSKKHGKLKNFNSANISANSFNDTYQYLKFNMVMNFDEGKELEFEVNLMNRRTIPVAKYQIKE